MKGRGTKKSHFLEGKDYRTYKEDVDDDPWAAVVKKTYLDMHTNQTVDFVKEKVKLRIRVLGYRQSPQVKGPKIYTSQPTTGLLKAACSVLCSWS